MTVADGFKKINFKRYRGIFLFASLPIMIIAISFGIVGNSFKISALINAFEFLFTASITFLSLSIACHSIVLSRETSKIATNSDNKMNSIAKSNFLEIYNEFSDKRIQLRQHPKILGFEGTIWKCKQYVEWATELEEWVGQKYQDKLAEIFSVLLDNTFDWINGIPIDKIVKNENGKQKIEVYVIKISNMDVNNILIMYEYFWGIKQESDELKGFKKVSDNKKLKLIKLLEKHIAKRKKNEKEDIDFIRNVRQEIQTSDDMKRKPFKRITQRKRLRKNP